MRIQKVLSTKNGPHTSKIFPTIQKYSANIRKIMQLMIA